MAARGRGKRIAKITQQIKNKEDIVKGQDIESTRLKEEMTKSEEKLIKK